MNVFLDPLHTSHDVFRRKLRPGPDGRLQRYLDLIAVTDSEQRTVAQRLRGTLKTHHGRDKIFKVVQYVLRLLLWFRGIDPQYAFVVGKSYTRMERTLMTITNTRRMFKLGRFIGEFARAGATLSRIGALVDIQRQYSKQTLAWLQLQMILDVFARLAMCVKSAFDDIGWAARKGFLHSAVEERMQLHAGRISIVVLAIDLFLNTLHLAQGVVDAASMSSEAAEVGSPGGGVSVIGSPAVSRTQQRRRRSLSTAGAQSSPLGVPPVTVTETSPPVRGEAVGMVDEGQALVKSSTASFDYSRVAPLSQPSSSAARPVGGAGGAASGTGGDAAVGGSLNAFDAMRAQPSFSLLSTYDELDRIQNAQSGAFAPPTPAFGGGAPGKVAPSSGRNSAVWDADRGAANMSTPAKSNGPEDEAAAGLTGQLSIASATGRNAEEEGSGRAESTPPPLEGAAAALDPAAAQGEPPSHVVVHSVVELLWRDKSLRWVSLHQLKLLLDLTVAVLMVARARSPMSFGVTATFGILSGLISVVRVWTRA